MAKSELHCELAQRALVWLEGKATGRGIRGCEEIILAEGYVADSVAISGLQIANEILFLGKRREWNSGESDDLIWVFESKVSRSDFMNTFKRSNHLGDRLTPIGNFHFVVTPKGLVKPEEVPTFWGLLERSGQGLRVTKMPELCETTKEKLYEIAYCILRGSHFGKFTLYTDQIQKFRYEQKELELKQ